MVGALRNEFLGARYHVMFRGNERTRTMKVDKARLRHVDWLRWTVRRLEEGFTND